MQKATKKKPLRIADFHRRSYRSNSGFLWTPEHFQQQIISGSRLEKREWLVSLESVEPAASNGAIFTAEWWGSNPNWARYTRDYMSPPGGRLSAEPILFGCPSTEFRARITNLKACSLEYKKGPKSPSGSTSSSSLITHQSFLKVFLQLILIFYTRCKSSTQH